MDGAVAPILFDCYGLNVGLTILWKKSGSKETDVLRYVNDVIQHKVRTEFDGSRRSRVLIPSSFVYTALFAANQ